MVCKKCGKENDDNMKFCGECGAIVPISDVEIIDYLPWCPISEEIGGYEIY